MKTANPLVTRCILLLIASGSGVILAGDQHASTVDDRALTKALIVESVKSGVRIDEELERGNVKAAIATNSKLIGDQLYFIDQGLKNGDTRLTELAPSLCPRLDQLKKIAARLPKSQQATEGKERFNRELREDMFSSAIDEIRKLCK